MKKKIMALCLVAILAITAIGGATLAYFTDYSDVAVNTFTVGNIDIELDETDITNPNGDRVIENKYEDIYPGQTVTKDPMVTVEGGSEPCYVRMFVTVDQAKLVKAFPVDDADFADYWQGEIFLLEKLVDGTWNPDIWEIQDNVKIADGKAVYEFRYFEIVPENAGDTKLAPLFQTITFPAALNNNQAAELNNFQVDVYAEAIQSEGFADAATAWNNFVKEAKQ